MNIEILTYLRDNPTRFGKTRNFQIRGILTSEIEHLEQLYNNSNAFPKALRELLFLAGDYCHVLDFGLYDSQEEMQTDVRDWMLRFNRSLSRPFFAIDVYNPGDNFLYVYLDEGDDPIVHAAYLPTRDDILPFRSLERKLSDFINAHIDIMKKGFNPF